MDTGPCSSLQSWQYSWSTVLLRVLLNRKKTDKRSGDFPSGRFRFRATTVMALGFRGRPAVEGPAVVTGPPRSSLRRSMTTAE